MNEFENIDNNELQEILKYVGDEPVFFYYDNDFLIYNINENVFEKLNIVDEIIFEKINSIEKYLKLLKEYK